MHNITTSWLSKSDAIQFNKKTSLLFAFTWQLMHSQLSSKIISDFNSFVSRVNLQCINTDGELSRLLSYKSDSSSQPGAKVKDF